MSDQLKVDLGRLNDLSVVLSRLRNDLETIPNRVDGYAGSMGHQGLTDATHAVGDDWTRFRNGLISDISALGAFAEQACKAYQDSDAALSKVLTDLMEPPAPPTHGGYRTSV